MTPEAADALRRASAHVLVDDVRSPALDDRDAHHVFRVLRVRDGETVTVTDGRGAWRACRAAGDAVEPVGEAAWVPRREPRVEIGFAIPKQDRPEWIVQKLTELGVDRIVLLHAERSVVRWSADRAEKHLAKLRRVAAEALQQSRGVWLPEIAGPFAATEVLSASHAAEPGAPVAVDEVEAGPDGVRRVAIGPEGGWSATEIAVAAGTVRIGTNVLRVETAALVAGAHLLVT